MSRRAARKDENHDTIKEIFYTLLSGHVTDTSAAGDGLGDLFVSFGGESGPAWGCFVEIKRDAKADFTAAQIRFRKTHPGMHKRIETADQAIALCNLIRANCKALCR